MAGIDVLGETIHFEVRCGACGVDLEAVETLHVRAGRVLQINPCAFCLQEAAPSIDQAALLERLRAALLSLPGPNDKLERSPRTAASGCVTNIEDVDGETLRIWSDGAGRYRLESHAGSYAGEFLRRPLLQALAGEINRLGSLVGYLRGLCGEARRAARG